MNVHPSTLQKVSSLSKASGYNFWLTANVQAGGAEFLFHTFLPSAYRSFDTVAQVVFPMLICLHIIPIELCNQQHPISQVSTVELSPKSAHFKTKNSQGLQCWTAKGQHCTPSQFTQWATNCTQGWPTADIDPETLSLVSHSIFRQSFQILLCKNEKALRMPDVN
jgi:hypothetical protein